MVRGEGARAGDGAEDSKLAEMPEPAEWTSSRGGLLSRRRFLALLAIAAVAGPLLVFHEASVSPLTRIPCGRPAPNQMLGDPVIILSVMGRTWDRWDRGDFSRTDDRVFAPYPDTWKLGEPWLLPAVVGYPWARLTGSPELGYNVPYFLAAAVACFAAGLLLADLAGPGWAALAGAVLFAWSPARLNNFGVIGTMWAGFVPLVLLFALRFLRFGRPRDAALASASLVVTGLGSTYPLVMGSVVVAVVAVASAKSFRRLLGLGLALGAGVALLAAWYWPFLGLAREWDAPLGASRMEVQAADLLSVLHTGLFAGPLRDLLDRLVPGFPEGAAACFPTLAVLGVFLVSAFLLRGEARGERSPGGGRDASPWTWLVLAGLCFVFALGPTIRFAGQPLFPGPYRLLAGLPGISGMRGLNRWDQWVGLGLVVAATILLGRLLRGSSRRRGALVLAGLAPLLALDLWPRTVPAQPLPPPSPFNSLLRALPREAILAVHPYRRETSDRSWGEQLSHGRRVVNGYQSFPPPIHDWLVTFLAGKPFEAAFAVYSELGATAIEVDLEALPRSEGERIRALVASRFLPGVRADARSRAPSRLLLLLEPRPPVLVDPRSFAGLRFEGGSAVVARASDRLVFRLGSARVDVEVESAAGRSRDVLLVPVVGAGELVATLSKPLPPGAIVRLVGDGREIGRRAPEAAPGPPSG